MRSSLASSRREWFGTIRPDVLSGLVVGLALIPEAIGFSIIAGVDPRVGLFASCIIPIVTAFVGGRPALISAATGAMALLVIGIVKEYGLAYLLVASILAGVWQIGFGALQWARYLRFVPRSVMTGFVNALAILIFSAQLPQLLHAAPMVYALVALGLLLIYGLPLVTKLVPSPLVAVLVVSTVAIVFHVQVPRVGDMGALPASFPVLSIPHIVVNFDTMRAILPLSFALALVGVIESLLTAQLVDDKTDTGSDKNRECVAQGTANIFSGFFGGMAGCGMIGQTMINVTSGGRGRLSTFVAGSSLLVLIVSLQHVLFVIPMAALVAVMIVVALDTFDWSSIRTIFTFPRSDTFVMIATVIVTLFTKNLSIGVVVGVLLSALFFARKISKLLTVTSALSEDGSERTYYVHGQLFFVSSNDFIGMFDLHEHSKAVTIDVTHSHLWDTSAIHAIDTVVLRLREKGSLVNVVGLNAASATLVDSTAVHDKGGVRSGSH